jgi:ribosome biogenesis protein MAK21
MAAVCERVVHAAMQIPLPHIRCACLLAHGYPGQLLNNTCNPAPTPPPRHHHREPSYAAAETSCCWELLILGSHLHPSVSAFARALLSGTHVAYDGDPLREFTLPVFLDKFVAKKPKAAGARGSSLMQPLLGAAAAADKADRGLAELGSEAFAALAEAQVDPSELFFHKFYSLKGTKPKAKKVKAKRDEEGSGSSSDEGDGDGGDSDDLGELGVDDVASDGDLDDDVVDRWVTWRACAGWGGGGCEAAGRGGWGGLGHGGWGNVRWGKMQARVSPPP